MIRIEALLDRQVEDGSRLNGTMKTLKVLDYVICRGTCTHVGVRKLKSCSRHLLASVRTSAPDPLFCAFFFNRSSFDLSLLIPQQCSGLGVLPQVSWFVVQAIILFPLFLLWRVVREALGALSLLFAEGWVSSVGFLCTSHRVFDDIPRRVYSFWQLSISSFFIFGCICITFLFFNLIITYTTCIQFWTDQFSVNCVLHQPNS